MISDYEEVVIRFKAYRISYPLTQKELSDKSGVSNKMMAGCSYLVSHSRNYS